MSTYYFSFYPYIFILELVHIFLFCTYAVIVTLQVALAPVLEISLDEVRWYVGTWFDDVLEC